MVSGAKRVYRRFFAYISVVGIVAAGILSSSSPASAVTGINQQINFQGRLFNSQGATVPDGYYNVQFKIYQDGTGTAAGNPGGTLKWTESWLNSAGNGVQVKNGFMSVELGTVNPFGSQVDWNQSVLWLSMNIGNTNVSCAPFTSCAPDGEMVPMKRLSSTPYAMNAGQLGGKTAADFIQNQNVAAQTATNFWISGSGTASTLQATTNVLTPTIDTATAGALGIGSSNATQINLNQNTVVASGKTFTINGSGFDATGKLGIGTTAPSRPLSVAVNTTSVNSLPVVIAQTGTGDVGIEYQAAGSSSFYTGIDATDRKFKIGSSASAGAATTHGYTTIGSQNIGANYDGSVASKITMGTTGVAQTISVYMNSLDSFCPAIQVGIYADNGSGTSPTTLLSSSTAFNSPVVGWNTVPISPLNVTSGTVYWLALSTECTAQYKGEFTGGTVAFHDVTSGYPLNSTFAPDSANAAFRPSIYTTVYSAASVTDNFSGTGSLFALSETGQLTLKNSTNSSSAFQIQKADGSNVLNTDTTNGYIGIGSAASAPTATLQVAGTFTSAGGAINLNASSNFAVNIATGTSTGAVAIGNASNANNTVTIAAGATGGISLSSDKVTLGLATTATTLQKATQTTAATAGANLNIQGATGNTTGAGGAVNITGGTGGATNANGGDVNLSGGTATGTGTKGLVNLGASSFSAATNAACASNCTITQSNVDGYGTVIISASTADITISLPNPTNQTAQGRILYLTTSSTSQDFTLAANSGGNLINVAMRKNTTATMIWNGSAWTPGGASNATTLQATYANGTNPSTTPEIKLDSTRSTIDIQDADTSIGADILNIRGSNAGGLGTVLFGVSNTGRVTIQGTTDQDSAFRVLNSAGDYLLNINSANGYVLNNSIRSAGNEINNPGFESGGQISGGEEGWFGPAVANIQNSTLNSHTGNYSLSVTANSSNIDVFAGTYFEVNAGESLSVEGWVRNTSGATGNAGVQITWYDKDKVALSNTTAYPNNPGTTYVLRKASGTAPAGTVYARVSATVRSNATTGFFYFDDFYMKRNTESSDMTYRTSVDSTAAFRIQSASGAQTLFTANTSDNILKVGDSTGTNTATTLLVLDGASTDPTTLANRDGGLFYNTTSNSLKAVIGGAVVDICTTAVTCTGYSASAGSSIQLQGTSPGTAQTGNFNITGTGILTRLQTQNNSSGNTQGLVVTSGNATGGNSGDLTLDTGTATGTRGTIKLGTASTVATVVSGSMTIQGGNGLTLGVANSVDGSIFLKSSASANTITIKAPSSAGVGYSLVLPTTAPGTGECLKSDNVGNMYFQGCGVGVNFNLQDAYNNSSAPAEVNLSDGKNLVINAQETATDPSVLFDLQCGSTCATGSNGRFSVQNAGIDVFTVSPNARGVLIGNNSTSDMTLTPFQLDSYNGDSSQETTAAACSSSVRQGAMYYNTRMGSLRGCINGSWVDVSNPDTLGLLTFGIIPSTGNQPYDLPALVSSGYSGPCKVSRAGNNQVHVEPCTAYSGGRRVNIVGGEWYTNTPAQGTRNITLTTAAGGRWAHLCVDSSGNLNWTTTNGTSATGGSANPAPLDPAKPNLCLADVAGSTTTAGLIDDIYDTRTFSSAMKEAVNTSTAVEVGMLVDAGTSGAMTPATSGSAKLYGVVVASDGATSSGAPNAIVTTVGPAWIKGVTGGVGSNLGQAGNFVITSTTAGYAYTNSAIPNNSFYYSAGNTRTSFNTTCTTAANCSGSFYVNLIVR